MFCPEPTCAAVQQLAAYLFHTSCGVDVGKHKRDFTRARLSEFGSFFGAPADLLPDRGARSLHLKRIMSGELEDVEYTLISPSRFLTITSDALQLCIQ